MSIENNLKRIADALEQIAVNTVNTLVEQAFDEASVPAPAPAPAAPAPAPAPAAPAPAPAAPAPAPAPAAPAPAPAVTPMTREEMNAELVKESARLGGPDKIYQMFKEKGITGIDAIDPSDYDQLLAEVRKLS